MLALDTSGLLAAIGPEQPHHEEARKALLTDPGPVLLSPYVLAETDYMILKLAGVYRALEFLHSVSKAAYEMVPRCASGPAPLQGDEAALGDAFTILPADAN
jgi:predicted nucleic acid-binding protein